MLDYVMQGFFGYSATNFFLKKWHCHGVGEDSTDVQVLSQAHYDALMEQVSIRTTMLNHHQQVELLTTRVCAKRCWD